MVKLSLTIADKHRGSGPRAVGNTCLQVGLFEVLQACIPYNLKDGVKESFMELLIVFGTLLFLIIKLKQESKNACFTIISNLFYFKIETVFSTILKVYIFYVK